jgi:hypothetical protein
MNVTIEWRHKCHTVGGEEEGRCGCGVGVIHGGIPHGEACPPTGGAHGDGQYLWPRGGGGVLELWPAWRIGCGGGQYPPGGGGSQHLAGSGGGNNIKVCLATRDPPHSITGIGTV